MTEKNEKYVIIGRVLTEETKKGIAALTVEALDKDLLVDDRLGSATTGNEGNFKITYKEKDFKDAFFDQKPDIYLRIKDSKGKIIFTTVDKVRYEASRIEEINIFIPEDLVDDNIKIESERLEFKQLININPNYFGSLTDKVSKEKYPVVFPIKGNTKYEKLTCVGLYPEDNLLEATLEVKLPYGYLGSLCSLGSKEYVAFYIDYNDGAGFVSVGAASEVNVYDLSFVNGGHLSYAVRKAFIPKEYMKCNTPQLVRVRAILSWQTLPTGPGFVPVWGNVVESWVQIKPKEPKVVFHPIPAYELKPFEIPKLLDTGLLPEAKNDLLADAIPHIGQYMISGDKDDIKALIQRTIEAEEKIKEEGRVEEERFEYKNLIVRNPNYFGSISKSQDKDEILKAVYTMPKITVESLLPKLTVNPELLIPVKPLLYNTKYEELKCVGLYPGNDLLEAIVEVKLPYGFNGNLCTLGSTQYVAFYIDYLNGAGYQHIATSTVAAHDIPQVSTNHLFYAVRANIANIAAKLKLCSIENIVKVKAILSWNQDPTAFGHMYLPTWGNVLVRNIQLRAIGGASNNCDIEIVNEVHTGEIIQAGADKGYAIKIDSGGSAVPFVFDRPFGGRIACWGKVNIPGAQYYRFRYSDNNGATWKDITDKRVARDPLPWIVTLDRFPDSEGWFNIGDYNTDEANYSLTTLVHWNSAGKNGNYVLRLELGALSGGVISAMPGQTSDVHIHLDNKGIELFEFGGTPAPLPAEGVVVKDNAGNYKKCAMFVGAEAIRIFGNFSDDHFRNYRLTVFGGNIAVSGVHIGSGRYDAGIPGIDDEGIIGAVDGGSGLELQTLNLCTIAQVPGKVKCAYGIKLTVWDRAIVGYVRGYEFDTSRHGRHAYVTFDWDPTGCP